MPDAIDAALGLAPALAWLWFLRRKDDWEPEPHLHLLRVFLLGGAAALAVVWLRPRLEVLLLPREAGLRLDLADAYLVTAGGEELAKLAAFLAGACWHRECDEPIDGIVYGAAAALGFAGVENAWFLAGDGPAVVLARTFTAIPAHVACSAAAGLACVLARGRGALAGSAIAAAGLALAVLLHGTYDLFLYAMPGLSAWSLALVLPAMLVALSAGLRWSRARSPLHHPVQAGGPAAGRQAPAGAARGASSA